MGIEISGITMYASPAIMVSFVWMLIYICGQGLRRHLQRNLFLLAFTLIVTLFIIGLSLLIFPSLEEMGHVHLSHLLGTGYLVVNSLLIAMLLHTSMRQD